MPKFFVFLCEGAHDQKLIQIVVREQSIIGKNCNHEKILLQKIRGGESTIIRDEYKRHQLRQTKKKFALIKNEMNQDICLEIFIELLKNGDSDYYLIAIFDADRKSFTKITKKIKNELEKNVIQISPNCFKIRERQLFFIIPQSLEIAIKNETGLKIDNKRGQKKQGLCLEKFLNDPPIWIEEFKQILI